MSYLCLAFPSATFFFNIYVLNTLAQVRELMNDFANSRYQSCLSYLTNLKGDLQLDIHLHMHLDRLYKMVEDKCLMQ